MTKVTEEKLLTSSERAAFSLRSLYRQYGYLPFKMSKFEEYDLYVRNKDFLISDNVITFNDTDGRLRALKPDVTLSIIKNSSCEPGCKQKVYYNENVYRVSQKLHRFKEIMQVGLECIGDTDILDTYEVVLLAVKSLAEITEDTVGVTAEIMLVARQLAQEFNLGNGYRVITNIGDDGGQTVHHLHFHLLGGKKLTEQMC